VRQKRIVASGAGLIVVAGLLLVLGYTFPSHPAPHNENKPTADEQASDDKPPAGHVVADDEPAGGEPKHVVVEHGQDTTLASRKSRLATLPEERYITIKNKVYPLHTYRMLSIPNDPSANQWWLASSGLPAMWDLPAGPLPVTLAVIDTGFALSHEEFAGRLYENSGETGATSDEGASRLNCTDQSLSLNKSCNLVDDNLDGIVDNESGASTYENPSQLNCSAQSRSLDKSCNRLDDDANGLVDDVTGWDFVDQHASVQAGKLNSSGEATTHGTMVAGVAAATGNNNKGIAGVDWRAKVLPIQAMDDDGYGDTRTVGDAIFYAVEQGADVINLSLGTSLADSYVREAIEAATAAGVVVVAASGNDGCDCLLYPAGDPEVLAVGALGSDGGRASFSSWGNNLDIMAPGMNMTLPSWRSSNATSWYDSGAAGTSFASPLVAGIASVMRSHSADIRPLHVIAALTEQSTRATAALFDAQYGFGTVKADAAVSRVTVPSQPQQGYIFGPVSTGAYHSPSASLELSGQYAVQECVTGKASTPVYELKQGSSHYFSMSRLEVRKAIASGYSATFFTYACQQMPHDTAAHLRTINLFTEFRDIFVRQ